MLLPPYKDDIFLYSIMILGIVLFFIYRPCSFGFLISGALIMPLAVIPYGIINNIINYGIDNALIEIEWAPLIVALYYGIYTLPHIIISVVSNAIINKIKSKKDANSNL
jgi:hypothetical protein